MPLFTFKKERKKHLCFYTCDILSLGRVWADESEAASRNLSAIQAGGVSPPGLDFCLCTWLFPACQISRLHQAPLRCCMKNRGMRGVVVVVSSGGVGVGSDITTPARRDNIYIPVWLQHGWASVWETRCNPHLHVFLPPCLIRVQCPPNEHSPVLCM